MFAVFSYQHYYPCGGWSDLNGVYPTKEEAIEAAQRVALDSELDFIEIVDLNKAELIQEIHQ